MSPIVEPKTMWSVFSDCNGLSVQGSAARRLAVRMTVKLAPARSHAQV